MYSILHTYIHTYNIEVRTAGSAGRVSAIFAGGANCLLGELLPLHSRNTFRGIPNTISSSSSSHLLSSPHLSLYSQSDKSSAGIIISMADEAKKLASAAAELTVSGSTATS